MNCPAIYEVFKLRALEKFYLESACRGVILCSANRTLHEALSRWCARLGHPYQWRRLTPAPGPRPPGGIIEKTRQFLQRLPLPVQALAYLLKRWWSRRRRLAAAPRLLQGRGQMTVVTYFPNIDQQKAREGIFRSRYWGELVELLERSPLRVNWVWLYSPNDEYTFKEAIALRDRFNDRAQGKSRFYFLEEFLSPAALARGLGRYGRLLAKCRQLRRVLPEFHFPGSALNFYPFLAHDWRDSLFGVIALQGCLWIESFQSLAASLPHQDWGLYLWENQPWERALNAAWEESAHGKLVGFQHVSPKPLDLRRFEDPRSYRLTNLPPPLPDLLAVGGSDDLDRFIKQGIPQERLVKVEALRYMYLQQALGAGKELRETADKRVLLAVTGNMASETTEQLALLARALRKAGLDRFDKILVKPHPDCPVDRILAQLAPDVPVTVVYDPLSRLWAQADLVYTANSTSASVEAALLGLPLIVHVVEDTINLSPLFGRPGAGHVGTVAEFLHGLNSPSSPVVSQDYFCLDEGLPRWRSLLGI
jgi:surface carbohydrate biosynthesis protein (TIGR04326 family)